MKHKVAFLVLALVLTSTGAKAQEFSTDSEATTDDQVLNSGTTIFAYDVSGLAATVNGVAFSGDFYPTFTNFRGISDNDLSNSAMSGALNDALSVSTTGSRGTAGIEIDGLTSGNTYQLQLFTAGAGTAGSETVTDGLESGDLYFGGDGVGAYSIVDTFVAANTTEYVTITPDSGGTVTISAINLQQEQVQVEDAPEPATLPLCLGGGLAVLAMSRGGRRVAA